MGHSLELLPPIEGLAFNEVEHKYTVAHKHLGELVIPSVTQVMTATEAKCMNYSAWRNSLLRNGVCSTIAGADAYMEQHRNHRATVGTQFHHLSECYLLGAEPKETFPEAQKMFKQWLEEFYPRIGKVLVAERPLLHRAFFYAGAPDLLAEVDGVLTLLDNKTQQFGKTKVHKEWQLQIGGYAGLIQHCYGVSVANAAMLIVTSGNIIAVPYNRADIVQGNQRFLGFLAEFHALQARLGSLPNRIALTAMQPLF